MESVEEILQSCRLCLVKEQVNIPIFEESSDLRKISEKINSCLPVKVAKDDNLPKKICDGCSYKLDMVYLFRNTSVDSEKQLIQWLTKAGLTNTIFNSEKDAKTSEILVKQESYDGNEVQNDLGADAHTYIMQQQKLPYQQDFAFPESSAANEEENGPLPKRPKRESAAKKKPPIVESEEEDDDDDDDFDNSMDVPKAEDNYSDEEEDRTDFDAPSTSADAQPGPSGVGTSEAPRTTRTRKSSTPRKALKNKRDLASNNGFCCPYCNRLCSTKIALKKHLKCHDNPEFQCIMCFKYFKSQSELRQHALTHDKTRPKFECELCGKSLLTKQGFDLHKREHAKLFTDYCEICNIGFVSKSKLKAHNERKHIKFQCDICGKSFSSKISLDLHRTIQHRDVLNLALHKFACKYCDKDYTFMSALKRHERQHKGDLSVVCDTCGKSFNGRDKLKRHLQIHTGEKPHACLLCPRRFCRRDQLIQHERVHTGDRPYVCKFCGRGFTQRTPLKVHERTHMKEDDVTLIEAVQTMNSVQSLMTPSLL